MFRGIRRVLIATTGAALMLPVVATSSAKIAAASTTDAAIVGVTPGWNLDSNDATMGPDIGTFDSCSGNATPGYVKDMNDWQGKHNSVIQFYDGWSTKNSSGQIIPSNPEFGYGGGGTCDNSDFVPVIWNVYDAVPMQTMEQQPPESEASCNEGTQNPYACFNDPNDPNSVTINNLITTYAQTLNDWLNGNDAYGLPQPTGGRRYYIRFGWESNGTWVPWGPAYVQTSTNPPYEVPEYADNCTDLFNAEMFNVAWWRYVHNAVDSYITPPSGESVNQEVDWVYSQYAYDPLTLKNDLGESYFPNVQNCAAQSNTVYSTSQPVNPSDLIEALYPGDDVTDWTGLDGYGQCTTSTNPSIPSPSSVFDPYVGDLHTFTTKPVSIDEVGVAIQDGGVLCSNPQTKTAWISDFMSYVQNNNVRMSLWFNDDENSQAGGVNDDAVFCPLGQDSECTSDETTNNTYTGSETGTSVTYGVYHAYQQGIQGTWWETPDPSLTTVVSGTTNPNGRVMDDATFQGTW